MEDVKQFLQHSTIHGLVYTSINRGIVRLLWIIVVIIGFLGSGFMIQQSITSWANNPISTTIETKPISDFTFPNVTVCPPRNSFTTLNPDLVRARTLEFTEEMRKEVSDHILDAILETDFRVKHLEFNDFKQEKFINWYIGTTKIDLPFVDYNGDKNFHLQTTSLQGSFSTAYFKEPFEDEKFERGLLSQVYIYKPTGIDTDSKIVIDIEYDIEDWEEEVTIEVYQDSIFSVEYESLYMEETVAQRTYPVAFFTKEGRHSRK